MTNEGTTIILIFHTAVFILSLATALGIGAQCSTAEGCNLSSRAEKLGIKPNGQEQSIISRHHMCSRLFLLVLLPLLAADAAVLDISNCRKKSPQLSNPQESRSCNSKTNKRRMPCSYDVWIGCAGYEPPKEVTV